MKKRKTLSILGDSISTYRSISDDSAANESTKYNPYYYREPFPLDKTYWRLVMSRLGLTLCVNNSWSGGNLSGRDDQDSGVMRAGRLGRDSGEEPDVIIVFMGINDLGRRVAPKVFAEDYSLTLMTIKKKHPEALVFCVNIPDRDIFLRRDAELFNRAIDEAVLAAGDNFFTVDLFGSELRGDRYYMNTLDGLHPDEDGMKMIADVIEEVIKAHI